MKAILGSFLLFCLALGGTYHVQVSKLDAYEKEPILLSLSYDDPNKETIVWVKFEPVAHEAFKSVLLDRRNTKGGYIYRYMLFALRPGDIKLPLELKIKRASKQEIGQDILGTGYEQTKPIEGVVEKVRLQPLRFHIRPAPKANLYGSFTLSMKLDKTKAKRYEPVYMTIALKGTGFDQIPKIWPKTDKKVKILADSPKKKIFYKSDGAHIYYERQFAFLADSNFTLLPIRLKEFDYHKTQILTTPSYSIQIAAEPPALAQENNPPKIKPVASKVAEFSFYLLIFLAGILSGALLLWILKKRYATKWDILTAKDERELLKILAPLPGFEKEREMLGEAIENKRKVSLWKIKRNILKGLS